MEQPCKSTIPIVRRICAFLNLGEEGKLDSFFGKVKRQLEKEIKFHKQNIESTTLAWEHKVLEHLDAKEDAEKALEEALMQVDVSKIQSNEHQSKYVEIYLANLDAKKNDLKRLEKEHTKALEAHTDKIEGWEKQIESAEARLKAIFG